MIITELYHGQGFGNQLFTYVATRLLAYRKGYEFGIQSPHKYKAPSLLNLDMGREVIGGSGPEGGPPISLPNGIEHYYKEYEHGREHFLKDDSRNFSLTDKAYFNLPDNLKLEGCFQSEGYFYDHFDLLDQWLKINPEMDHDDTNVKDLCIINFRGGDFIGNPGCYPPESYWRMAIENVLRMNPNMKFAIVTDDVSTAKQMLPEFEAYHRGLLPWDQVRQSGAATSQMGAWDYVALNKCRNIICSTSTFACFPLWLNRNLEICIAPKYWFDYNRSQGWWCRGSSIHSYVTHYMDKSGSLFTPEQCRKEWKQFYTENKIYSEQDLQNNYDWEKDYAI